MKNFIKKYPKRIFITALVVLLIAIVGTVNNYRTYREGIYYPQHHISGNIFDFLNEVYGKVSVKDRYGTTLLYYNEENLGSGGRGPGIDDKFFEVKIDSDSYANDDTMNITMENKLFSNVSFYTGKYLLQIYDEGTGRYYDVYGGVTAVRDKGELVCLNTGETYENKIQLGSLKNLRDKPIALIPGTYKLSIPFFVNNNPEYSHEEDHWITYKFKVE